MELFVESLALRRLSKEVKGYLDNITVPSKISKSPNLAIQFEQLYKEGKITKQDYLFLQARIILNDFCYSIEDEIGKGIRTGFTFYCKETHQLYFGAGYNYPSSLKKFLCKRPPTVCMETTLHYKDDLYIMPSFENWCEKKTNYDVSVYRDIFSKTEVKSGFSKRMRLNDFTFGTFECYYPYLDGATEEDILYVRERLQPIKEQLYHLREEMIESLDLLQTVVLNGLHREKEEAFSS